MKNDLEILSAKKDKTERTLAGIRQLPSIPKVLFEVTKLLNNPSAAPNQLAALISKDQGLTARMLTIANSPLYGIKRKVSSIEFAVLVLGLQETKDIVTALSLVDSFSIQNDTDFNSMEFWIHSMVVGTAAKSISQTLGYQIGGDAFVAGILHDLGIMVIYKFLHPQFKEILNLSNSTGSPIIVSEREVLGMTHQEVGKYLAEKWSLPLQLCESLNFHHTPILAKESREMTAIVHLCDYMTQKFNIAGFYWDAGIELDESIMEILKFKSKAELNDFIYNFEEDFRVTAESIKI